MTNKDDLSHLSDSEFNQQWRQRIRRTVIEHESFNASFPAKDRIKMLEEHERLMTALGPMVAIISNWKVVAVGIPIGVLIFGRDEFFAVLRVLGVTV